MSLNSIMNIATSGMSAAQTQLRVVSDNVSNINTPGYIRKIADQQSIANQGVGAGVEVARVRLATDRFLQIASLNASSESASQAVQYELYDSIQTLFGDPGQDGFFSKIDSLFSSLMSVAENATSGPLRQDALYKLQTVLEETGRVSAGIETIRTDADSRLVNAVMRTNELLDQIEKLNNEISKANVVGADSTGAQTAQNSLIEELSGLMDVRLTNRSLGGYEIRTGTGILLAGQGAARLSYVPTGTVNPGSEFNDIKVVDHTGQEKSLTENLKSGEIKGLLTIRDVEAPQASQRLAELSSRLVDELNRAHNASTTLPAPSALVGRNLGMSLENALAGFKGVQIEQPPGTMVTVPSETTIAVVDPAGRVLQSALITMTEGGYTINGQPATAADFTTRLSAALGGATVAFDNGRLSLSTTGGNGLAITDNSERPSSNSGRGFSHFFGLNDLVTSKTPVHYETGLKLTSQHGFAPGQTLNFRMMDGTGNRLGDIEFTIPPGGTVQTLVEGLNDNSSGLGRFGKFSLNDRGELVFAGKGNPANLLSVLKDDTSQADSGLAMSQLFGLGGARSNRMSGYSIRSDVAQDGNKLALAQLTWPAAVDTVAITPNDGRGGQLLANAYQNGTQFSPAGNAGAVKMSLSRYASEFSGELGIKGSNFKNKASSSELIRTEAFARRTAVEGVNLDEELVNLTTFQQAYNASARLVQAVTDMYDTLLGMVR